MDFHHFDHLIIIFILFDNYFLIFINFLININYIFDFPFGLRKEQAHIFNYYFHSLNYSRKINLNFINLFYFYLKIFNF
jgi:hypothetical protein